MIDLLRFGTAKQQLEVSKCFRKLLSGESSSTIRQVIDQINSAGLVSKFVEFLQRDNFELQSEAAWALANITFIYNETRNYSKTKCIIDAGAFPVLVRLLSSQSENVQEKAVWCLGNIASECQECNNLILDHGILSPLLE
jgi:importin subunit alpha-1